MIRPAASWFFLCLCLLLSWPRGAAAEAAGAPEAPGGEEAAPEAPAPEAPSVEEEGRDGESPEPPEGAEAPLDEPAGATTGDELGGTSTEEAPEEAPQPPGGPVVTDDVGGAAAAGAEDAEDESEQRASEGGLGEAIRCHFAGLAETDPVFSISRAPVTLGIVGSLQLLGVPFIQDPWASVEAGSIANAEGFRLRRARFGIVGSLARWLDLELRVELTEHGADILDANITFEAHPLARFTAGALKVPFSRVMMLPSEYQTFLQRPYPVRSIAPDRSLGLQIAGSMPWFSYFAGVWNGGGDYYRGDNNEGMLYAARVAAHPLGPLPPGEVTLPEGFVFQVAGSYYYNQDATGDRHAAGGELIVRWLGLTVQGEFLWSRFYPSGHPMTIEGIEYGHTERMGWFAEASYFILAEHLQVAFRYEAQLVSEAVEIRDLNDLWALSGAINGYLLQGRLKLSLVYEHRHEWFDQQVANDFVALQLQGRL